MQKCNKTTIMTAAAIILSYASLLSGFYCSGQKFEGSPSRRFENPRNNIGQPYFINPKNIIKKLARTTTYKDNSKKDILFPFYQKKGWLVYEDTVEVSGEIIEMHNSGYYNYLYNKPKGSGDGDFHIMLQPDPGMESYASKVEYLQGISAIHVEIDWNLRKNFPIFYDLAIGDHIRVKGRYVLDEAHGWKEIHPPYWIDFIEVPSIDTLVNSKQENFK